MGVPGPPGVESFDPALKNNAYRAVSILSPVIEGRKRTTPSAKFFIGAILMFQRMLPMNVTLCDREKP
jgi:hypothetical protein